MCCLSDIKVFISGKMSWCKARTRPPVMYICELLQLNRINIRMLDGKVLLCKISFQASVIKIFRLFLISLYTQFYIFKYLFEAQTKPASDISWTSRIFLILGMSSSFLCIYNTCLRQTEATLEEQLNIFPLHHIKNIYTCRYLYLFVLQLCGFMKRPPTAK